MRAVAIMCVRDEEVHVASALRDLIEGGLDVVLIDHDSTDRTVAVAQRYLGRGLLAIERLRWTGRFSLKEQLAAKWSVVERVRHDWIVHVDADEWLVAPPPFRTLLDGLRAADAGGYNCVHFDEFVFVPRRGEDLRGTDYRRVSRRYYFYQVQYPFLYRAWKNGIGLDNRADAGHLLSGAVEIRPFPTDFALRHYIALSEEHARLKYPPRPFDEDEIASGWHGDRLRARTSRLWFPADDDEAMRLLPRATSHDLDRSAPRARHFWDWPAA